MIRFLLPLMLLLNSTLFAQIQSVKIVPIFDPGDSWVQGEKNKFNFCYRENHGAVVDAKSNEIIDWIEFSHRIKKVTFDDDLLLVQTEFDGCLYDLKNFTALIGPQFKGSAGAINSKKKEIYTAFENDPHLPMTPTNLLAQESEPRAFLRVISLEGTVMDSIAILIRIPSSISIDGDKLEITGRMFYGGLCGGNRDNKISAPFETVDLKKRVTNLEHREIEVKYEEELKLPKPEGWYHACTLEAWLHEPSGILAVFGGGKQEGGAVKAFDLNTGSLLWAISQNNDFIPIKGFNKDGDLFGYCWLAYDTLNTTSDYVAMDVINSSINQTPQYIKPMLKFDLQNKTKHILSKSEFYDLELDSTNTKMIALEYDHFVDSISTEKYELHFNMNSVGLDILLKPSNGRLKLLFFDANNWLMHDEFGHWTGTVEALSDVNFVQDGKVLGIEEALKYRDDELLKSYFQK